MEIQEPYIPTTNNQLTNSTIQQINTSTLQQSPVTQPTVDEPV